MSNTASAASTAVADVHSRCLELAAARLGVPTAYEWLSRQGKNGSRRRWLRLDVGARTYFYRAGVLRHGVEEGALGPSINGFAQIITGNRIHTKEFLAARGLSSPVGVLFTPAEWLKAKAFFRALARPMCIKANRRRSGAQAVARVTDAAAFIAAFKAIGTRTADIVVEENVEGEEIRCFYVAPSVVAVRLKRSASVLGDGTTSIAQLIETGNRERAERAVPGHRPMDIDDDLLADLAGQGLALNDVPAAGVRITLRGGAGRTNGADSVACADSIHPSYVAVATAACQAIPALVVAAVDLIVRDRSCPAALGNHWVLDVIGSPAIADFHHPWEGPVQDVGDAIVRWLMQAR